MQLAAQRAWPGERTRPPRRREGQGRPQGRASRVLASAPSPEPVQRGKPFGDSTRGDCGKRTVRRGRRTEHATRPPYNIPCPFRRRGGRVCSPGRCGLRQLRYCFSTAQRRNSERSLLLMRRENVTFCPETPLARGTLAWNNGRAGGFRRSKKGCNSSRNSAARAGRRRAARPARSGSGSRAARAVDSLQKRAGTDGDGAFLL